MESHPLDALPEHPSLARREEPGETFPMSLAVPLGNDRFGKRTAEGIFARPAEDQLGLAIPVGDGSSGVDGDERVVGRLDDLAALLFFGAKRFLGVLEL